MQPPPNYIVFPFNAGIREDVSERAAVSPPHMTRVENYVIDKRGDFVPRGGFTAVTLTSTDTGNPNVPAPRYMFSTGRELCAITAHDLYGYLDEKDRWAYRGPVSPGTGRVRTAFRDGFSYPLFDVDGGTSFALGAVDAVERTNVNTNAVATLSRSVKIARLEADDFQPVNYNTTTAEYANGYASRSVAYGTNAHPLWLEGTSTPVNLKGAPYTLGDTSFPSAATIVSDVLYPGDNRARVYDAVGFSSSVWLLAYVDSGNDITLARCNNTPATTSTATISPGEGWSFQRVAICEDGSDLYVLASKFDASDNYELEVYSYDATTLGSNWGPVTVDTGSDSEYAFTNLGIAHGVSDSADRLGMVWTEVANLPGMTLPIAKSAYIDDDGTSLSSPHEHYNELTMGRPFWHDGQLYSQNASDVASGLNDEVANAFEYKPPKGTYPGGELFDLALLVRHPSPEKGVDTWRYVGAFNVGFAHRRDVGSCASVYTPSTGVYAWGSTAVSQTAIDYGSTYMAEELRLDTTRTPLAARVGEGGAAIIGGAMTMWFDGETTMELGQLTIPVLDLISEVETGGAAGAFVATDVAFYTAYWATYDAAGYLHRGAPSFTAKKTVVSSGTEDSITLAYQTGPSNRTLTRPNQLILFRGDTGDDLRAVNPSDLAIFNKADAHVTDTFTDEKTAADLSGRPPLYISGGELEAIHPEGARIPLVNDGRVWLGGFWRRNRVQYSKPINPGTGSEINIAPEFNEGFAMTIDGAEEVTGLASMDRTLVIFTEEAIFLNTGEGPNDDGSNPNGFSGPQRIASDAGCIEPRSVASYPEGVLFQSRAGIYQLDRGQSVRFIGDAVRGTLEDYPIVTSAVVVPKDNHVRFTVTDGGEGGRIIIYDYRAQVWITWHVKDDAGATVVPVAAALHEDEYYIAGADGAVFKYDTSAVVDAGTTTITKVLQTGWIQASQHGGYHRVQNIHALGERLGNATLSVTISTNFDPDAGSDQTVAWSDANLQSLPRTPDVLVRVKPRDQKGHAHQVTITDAGTGAGLRLSGLRFDIKRRADAGKSSFRGK